jgi:hypothetical protein
MSTLQGVPTYAGNTTVQDGSGLTNPPQDLCAIMLAVLTELSTLNYMLAEVFNPTTDPQVWRTDPGVISYQNLPLS